MEKNKLSATDAAFSKMSREKGMRYAFLHFADENVIKLNDGTFPAIGKDNLAELFPEGPSEGKVLTWEVLIVDVSASADMGYTFGNWKYTTSTKAGIDTAFYGNYVSIWKKQNDGTWKYVLDGGNETPKPENTSL